MKYEIKPTCTVRYGVKLYCRDRLKLEYLEKYGISWQRVPLFLLVFELVTITG
jgi:hypothetical protein